MGADPRLRLRAVRLPPAAPTSRSARSTSSSPRACTAASTRRTGPPSATPSTQVRPLADAVVERAAGRAFWELPDDEFSLLTEPGTVGALLREVREQPHAKYVAAALHHRHPNLVPLTNGTTWRQLIAHRQEADSGVEAVVHRELTANEDAFDALEQAVNSAVDGTRLTRLRLHDVLLWLSGSLRLTHAVQLGQETVQRVTQS